MDKSMLELTINGKEIRTGTNRSRRLIDFLREDLGLTSVKEGCSKGECGSCTVIINGEAVTSCLVLLGEVEGASIITLEGLAKDGELDPLQEAFVEAGAVQCGYCTPGMVLSAKAVLDKSPQATRDDIREMLAGNLCRCTGYAKIINAVEIARDRRNANG